MPKCDTIRAQRNAFPNDFRRDAFAADLQRNFADESKESLEQKDLAEKESGRAASMNTALDAWLKETGAQPPQLPLEREAWTFAADGGGGG